jgi:hypothetical protein
MDAFEQELTWDREKVTSVDWRPAQRRLLRVTDCVELANDIPVEQEE